MDLQCIFKAETSERIPWKGERRDKGKKGARIISNQNSDVTLNF